MSKLLHHFDTLVIYVSFSDRKSSAVSIKFHSGNFYLKRYVFPGSPFSEHFRTQKRYHSSGILLLCIFKLSFLHICVEIISLLGAANTLWYAEVVGLDIPSLSLSSYDLGKKMTACSSEPLKSCP